MEKKSSHNILFLMTLTVSLMLTNTGCQTTTEMAQKVGIGKKPETPSNFFLDEERVYSVQQVVMMPVYAPDVALTTESDIDQQFLSKLTATQLFEVVLLSREDLVRRFGRRSFNSASVISDSVFKYIEDTTSADAVVFFDITTYHPFQPIRVGVRGKMITLQDKKMIWAVDQLFDAATRKTSQEAMRYEKKYLTKSEAGSQNDGILMSPTRFVSYAAENTVLTLPENSLSQSF